MKEEKKKKQQGKKEVSVYPTCPYCCGLKQYTGMFYLEEHIKHCHPEKMKSLI